MTRPTDYDLASRLINRPGMVLGRVETLREVLALLRGAAIALYPPHGSGFLPGFNEFVSLRLNGRPPRYDVHIDLLREFGDRPLNEGLDALDRLLREWKASSTEGEQPDRRSPPPD